ncbi:MAG: hypothetical protein OER88_02680 [Planctomycetota bacterium]|nr:hypothetical protein [Planctomycetota bacterium]
MLRLLLLLVVAAPAAATPKIRWINRFGDGKTAEFRRVIREDAKVVEIEVDAGESRVIPVWRIIWLEREDDAVAEERALLHARRDVRAGLRLAKARATLDKLASGGPKWRREYARASRALAAARSRDADAVQRLEAFAKEFPESRFLGAVIRAHAVQTVPAKVDKGKLVPHFRGAFERIGEAGGPIYIQCATLRDTGLFLDLGDPGAARLFSQAIRGGLREKADKKNDVAWDMMAETVALWCELDSVRARRLSARVRGEVPRAALRLAERLARRADLYLEELRCDVWLEVASLREASGKKKSAAEARGKAAALAQQIGDAARIHLVDRARVKPPK